MFLSSPGLAAAVTSGVDITATEGSSFTKRVVNLQDCTFESATIDWGDGTPTSAGEFETGNPPGVKGTHTYADEGTYQGSVTYTTDCTTNGIVNFTATVGDAPISAQGRDISPSATQQFTGVVSHVIDSNGLASASDFTAQISWGDGSHSAGQVVNFGYGYFDIQGTHTYKSPGSAAVNVTVTDVGGSTASSSSSAKIAPPPPTAAKFTYSPAHPCQESQVSFDTTGTEGGTKYIWSFSDTRHGTLYPPSGTYDPARLFRFRFGGDPPSDFASVPDGTEVHLLRPPVTAQLTVRDDAGNAISTDPQTITFRDQDAIYVKETAVRSFFGGTYPETYFKPGVVARLCPRLTLPLEAAQAFVSPAPVELRADHSLITTVTCKKADCLGTLYALGLKRPAKRPSGRLASARLKRRRLPVIAKKAFFVRGGRKQKVALRLTKRGRRLARKGHLKRVRLLLLMHGDKPRKRIVGVRRPG